MDKLEITMRQYDLLIKIAYESEDGARTLWALEQLDEMGEILLEVAKG